MTPVIRLPSENETKTTTLDSGNSITRKSPEEQSLSFSTIVEHRKSNPKLENSVFIRLVGVVTLLLLGSYLTAIAFTGITLLPLTVVASAVSGSNSIPCAGITPFCTTATLEQLMQIFISELATGILCLAGSLFVAFFRFQTVGPDPRLSISQVSIPKRSGPSELLTEELVAELKQRMPRT
jgi:hypothetical protein